MIQVLGLRDYRTGKLSKKREVFFSKGWRFSNIADVFNANKLNEMLAQVPEDERYNLYFTVADCFEERGRKLKEQWAIPFDIDNIDVDDDNPLESAYVVGKVAAEALGVAFEEMFVTFSGNGIQLFILLQQPIIDDSYFDAARLQYAVLCKRIEAMLTERGLAGTLDTSVWSKGRLMRLPNTLNRKPNKPERMAAILNGSAVAKDFDLYAESGVVAQETHALIPDEVLKNYPVPDTSAVCKGCKFLEHCKTNPDEVTEPQWYAMVSITSRLENGRDLTHEYSQGHKDYNHYETENKIEQALASAGPRTCKNIDSLWGGCSSCDHYERVTSPIMIKGDDYIASKDFGFRRRVVRKGNVSAGPVEHIDLVKQFRLERPYKVVKDSDQVIVYNGKHWEYMNDRELKAWAMSIIRPTPSNAEMVEFTHQLKAFNLTSIDELYTNRDGYMNFENCVLNLRTLETTPHSPDYGFFQVLPFPYDKSAKAPTFEQFMLDINLGDAELAETLKEYMGYCISGDECWLQRALLMVGDGANGKSVLLETMAELVGEENHAAVPMQELEKDTMRKMLVNKLFNYSEETSFRALSDSSLFKTLVSGGAMSVKELYVQPYHTKNRAKIIMSSNHMPQSSDTSYGFMRRLAIINMKATFKPGDGKHDYYIKDKLLEELSGICNSLIEAYARLKARGVLLGERKLQDAVTELQQENTSVGLFLKEEVTIDKYGEAWTTSRDMYETYSQFCYRSGLRALSIVHFSRAVTTMTGIESDRRRVGEGQLRGFKGITLVNAPDY